MPRIRTVLGRALVLLSLMVSGLVGVLTAAPAQAACPIDDPDCGVPTTFTFTSKLSVTTTSGTVTSDSFAGHSISCGSTCSVTDKQVVDSDERPADGWHTYTLTATGGPLGYSPAWTGCDSVGGGTCNVTNDQANRTVSLAWADTTKPTVSFNPPSVVGPTGSITAGGSDNSGAVHHYAWTVDNVVQAATGSTLFIGALPAGDHSVSVRSYDASGNASEPVTRTVTLDKSVGISLGTLPAFTNVAPTLTFTSDADVVARSCGVGDTLGACTSPTSYAVPSDLVEGSHTVSVRVTDAVGNVATGTRSFVLDRTEPSVAITGGPVEGSVISTPQADFPFTASDANLDTVLCRLDAAAAVDCKAQSPFQASGFGEGAHTLTVTATDKAGNVGTAVRHFSSQRLAASMSTAATSTPYGGHPTLTASGLGAATGTVVFTKGATTLCQKAVSSGSAGCAVVPVLGAGTHTVTATYSGDGAYAPTSVTVPVTITKAATRLTAKPTRFRTRKGRAVTLVATVTPAAAGRVYFKQGSKTLCSAVTRSGKATCLTSRRLAKGLHPVVATYTGSANHKASTARTSFRIT